MFNGLRTLLRGYGSQHHDWLKEHQQARLESKQMVDDGWACTYDDKASGERAVYVTDSLGNVRDVTIIA